MFVIHVVIFDTTNLLDYIYMHIKPNEMNKLSAELTENQYDNMNDMEQIQN